MPEIPHLSFEVVRGHRLIWDDEAGITTAGVSMRVSR